jgi:hypothetical protein
MSHSPESVLAVLADRKPSLLIGVEETAQIDFKSEPYDLTTDKGKWELGKDVAGMTNFAGGVIVIGVHVRKTDGNFSEVASMLCPVPARSLNARQYHDIIRNLVRPAVRFECAFHEDPDKPGNGYMTIRVHPLEEHERWAMVRRLVTHEGKPVEGFGIPVRDGDQTRWLSADEVYRLVRDGQRSVSPGGQALSVPQDSPSAVQALSPDELDEVVDRLVAFNDWQDQPVLAWQSAPNVPQSLLPVMWENDGIAHKLRFPESLRGSGGFNWNFWKDAVRLDGGVLLSDGRHAMWVRQDGVATAAAVVSDEMLAWATHSPAQGPFRLNLIALAEMTLEYFRLIDGTLVTDAGTQYRHAIITRGFAGSPGVTLSTAVPPFTGGMQYEADEDGRYAFDASGDPGADAFDALWRLFTVFRQPKEKVPFSDDGKVSKEELLEFLRTQR